MWTIAAANKKFNGPLGSYDGLTDVHLAHYFARPIRKSQLKSAKLITCDGTIIPEHKVKVQSLQYEKKKKKYDVLANAVVQNAVQKDIGWKKNIYNYLEDISNMEIVEKIKTASRKKNNKMPCNTAKASWDILPKYDIFGLLTKQELRNKVPHLRSAPAMCSCNSRNGHKVSVLKRSSSAKAFSPYVVPLFNGSSKHQTWHALQQSVHSGKRKKKCRRKKIFNDTIDSQAIKHSATDQLLNINRSKITLYYHGHAPLTNSLKHLEQNVLIQQQHCGGNPVVVYKGTVSPNETLTFTSVLHEGFPFSITIFLDGIRDLKLSSCCVFRYLPNRRLGGSSGSFSIQNVEGGKPCMKCQYHEFQLRNTISTKKDDSEENALSRDVSHINDKSSSSEPSKEEITDRSEAKDAANENTGTGNEEVPADSFSSDEIDANHKSLNLVQSEDEEIEEKLDALSDSNHPEFATQSLDGDILEETNSESDDKESHALKSYGSGSSAENVSSETLK